MKKWILFGKEVHDDLHDEIYVQFVANVFSALVTAAMIGAYHFTFPCVITMKIAVLSLGWPPLWGVERFIHID